MTTTQCTCTGCAVQQGTHQPAEALHQIAEPDAKHLQELAAYRFTVENLRERVAELEAERTARMTQNDRMAERIAELESQLEAIGAGGVEPLRKQAAAQQAVPEQSVPVGYVALAALTSRTHADDYAPCFATEAALLENYPAAKAIAVFDHAATQPAAQGVEAS